MSCNIYINEKKVFKTSCRIFDSLDYGFLEESENSEFAYFITNMEQANEMNCCYGFDIGDFIRSKKSVLILIDLLKKIIHKIKHQLKDWALADLWKFHTELIKYKEELEAQGK